MVAIAIIVAAAVYGGVFNTPEVVATKNVTVHSGDVWQTIKAKECKAQGLDVYAINHDATDAESMKASGIENLGQLTPGQKITVVIVVDR